MSHRLLAVEVVFLPGASPRAGFIQGLSGLSRKPAAGVVGLLDTWDLKDEM